MENASKTKDTNVVFKTKEVNGFFLSIEKSQIDKGSFDVYTTNAETGERFVIVESTKMSKISEDLDYYSKVNCNNDDGFAELYKSLYKENCDTMMSALSKITAIKSISDKFGGVYSDTGYKLSPTIDSNLVPFGDSFKYDTIFVRKGLISDYAIRFNKLKSDIQKHIVSSGDSSYYTPDDFIKSSEAFINNAVFIITMKSIDFKNGVDYGCIDFKSSSFKDIGSAVMESMIDRFNDVKNEFMESNFEVKSGFNEFKPTENNKAEVGKWVSLVRPDIPKRIKEAKNIK